MISQLPWHPKSLTFREGKALGVEAPPKGYSWRLDVISRGRTQEGTIADGPRVPSEGGVCTLPFLGFRVRPAETLPGSGTPKCRHLLLEGVAEGQEGQLSRWLTAWML